MRMATSPLDFTKKDLIFDLNESTFCGIKVTKNMIREFKRKPKINIGHNEDREPFQGVEF